MIITFGLVALFCVVVIVILQRAHISDRSFTDYAVGGRSFGPVYQAMSFLNTWWPGATFLSATGFAASAGVIGFYSAIYSLLTVVLMYLLAQRVWLWGKAYDLRTQPDLLVLRFRSRWLAVITSVIGIVSSVPWLVLGFQSLGDLFEQLSLGKLGFTTAVLIGVAVMVIRQFWTIRMGMRGVIISDLFQGIVAYIGGTLLLLGLVAWLVWGKGITLGSVSAAHFGLPGLGSAQGPLYVFAILFTGALGGWCWPSIFIRLYTADSVKTVLKAGAIGAPLSVIFALALGVLGLLASPLPEITAHPDMMWFTIAHLAGGPVLLGLAGVVVLAATMGNVDGNIQAMGAQVSNDIVGGFKPLGYKSSMIIAKVSMAVVTVISAWISCYHVPHLFELAILAYQGIIQIAVPLYLGIFWKRGNAAGAITGMVVGFIVAVCLQLGWLGSMTWAYGLTSGAVGIAVNLLIYVAAAYLIPMKAAERARVNAIFAATDGDAAGLPVSDSVLAGAVK
ncbi:sodium:solute symporter family protein [Acidisoma silvae]|uniref:Sodium:solute symporter family protein n=1 Tax=Acidisoma silvae TaxID=2802396 RepID=A0A963YS19_9PROT|nr:sodium:solute symporter family protein [Acidisoma silvae]MCB8875936.1 sodium:solute symporter family protein [Acidisoma silvae]